MHTEGKLTVGKHGVIVAGPFIEYTFGSAQDQFAMVCCPSADDADKGVNQNDNTRRLVACWNAIQEYYPDINTEDLERLSRRQLGDHEFPVTRYIRERDELVKALRDLCNQAKVIHPDQFSSMSYFENFMEKYLSAKQLIAKYPEQP